MAKNVSSYSSTRQMRQKNSWKMKDYIQIGIEKGQVFENYNLPLPPKEKQLEVAHRVYEMRQQAKSLQQEGKRILETGKQEVERMILSVN